MTAKEWRESNPDIANKGNIRDYTDLLHLVILNILKIKSMINKHYQYKLKTFFKKD